MEIKVWRFWRIWICTTSHSLGEYQTQKKQGLFAIQLTKNILKIFIISCPKFGWIYGECHLPLLSNMSLFGFFALVYTLNHKKIIAVININFWWSQPCLKQRISDLGILYLVILDQNTEIVLAVKREGFKSLVITF